jgi:hypothetical protein
MIAAAAGGALFVVVLLTLQGRRSRRREAALVGVTDEWPWLTAKASGDVSEVSVERLRTAPGMPTTNGVAPERAEEEVPERVAEPAANGVAAERVAEPERAAEPAANGAAAERALEAERAAPAADAEHAAQAEPAGDDAPVGDPDFDVVEAGAVPRRRFDREEASNGRPVSARRGPICQVRWSSGGMCFYAVTTDADGVEQRVAWSPPIEWDDAGPPDEDSRQARAALRVIAKDLRDKGWRPMRAKGSDFDEQRWYARRFRFPVVEGEDAREAVARARGGS